MQADRECPFSDNKNNKKKQMEGFDERAVIKRVQRKIWQ